MVRRLTLTLRQKLLWARNRIVFFQLLQPPTPFQTHTRMIHTQKKQSGGLKKLYFWIFLLIHKTKFIHGLCDWFLLQIWVLAWAVQTATGAPTVATRRTLVARGCRAVASTPPACLRLHPPTPQTSTAKQTWWSLLMTPFPPTLQQPVSKNLLVWNEILLIILDVICIFVKIITLESYSLLTIVFLFTICLVRIEAQAGHTI
jgi:hypothetical protein